MVGMKVSAPQLSNGLYLTILLESLSFLYCTQNKVDFYHCGQSIGESFSPREGDSLDTSICDEENEAIFNKVNSEGNLVFILPDSFADRISEIKDIIVKSLSTEKKYTDS